MFWNYLRVVVDLHYVLFLVKVTFFDFSIECYFELNFIRNKDDEWFEI